MTNIQRLSIVLLLFVAATVHAFGGSSIFGVFRKRRRTLQDIQEKRVEVASRRGFAGPHGELLTLKEFEALQHERAREEDGEVAGSSGFLSQILNVFDRFCDNNDKA